MEAADDTVGRLLGCVDDAFLTTAEAQAESRRLGSQGANRPNEQRFPRIRFERSSEAYGTDEWLRDGGADVKNEPNRSIREASRSLAASRKAIGDSAESAACSALLEKASELREAVSKAESSGAHPLVIDDAWGEIAQAAHVVAEKADLEKDGTLRARVLELALAVATCPCPRPRDGQDQSLDGVISWGTPHARGDAAEVLAAVASVVSAISSKRGNLDVGPRWAEIAI